MRPATKTVGHGPKQALLVHGLSSNGDAWRGVAPRLAELGYTITMEDLRGHVESLHADSYRIADYAANVAKLDVGWA
jgi:pimeloyl-ACP methyl ester carboxylesterase